MMYKTASGERVYSDGDGAPDNDLLKIREFVFRAGEVYNLRSAGSGELREAYVMKILEESADGRVSTVELQPVTDSKRLKGLAATILDSQTEFRVLTRAHSITPKKAILDDSNPSQEDAIRHLENL